MYPSEIPTQPPGTLTYPLALSDLAFESTDPSSSLGSRLSPISIDPFLLLTPLEPCLPSSSSGLAGNLARKPFAWVSHQNRQWIPLTDNHSVPQKRIPHIVPHSSHPYPCQLFTINYTTLK